MSDNWPHQPGLENDPSQALEAVDFTQHKSQSGLPTQMLSLSQYAYQSQAPGPSSSHVMPVELQQYYDDARASQLQHGSTQQHLHLSDASIVRLQSQHGLSPSTQPKQSNATRRTPVQSYNSPVRGKHSPQRFSPYPSGSPRSQSKHTARLGTPTPSSGPILQSPNRQRGSTRSPSAKPATATSQPPSASLQSLHSGAQAPHTQIGVGQHSQTHRRTMSSDLAVQAHIQNLTDRIYKENLARYTTQYGIRIQDIHPDVLASFKSRAFARAHQLRYQDAVQRNHAALQQATQVEQSTQMLPPAIPWPVASPGHASTFDGQNSPEPTSPSRQKARSEDFGAQSPSSSHHNGQAGALVDEKEDLLQAHSQQTGPDGPDSAPAPIAEDVGNVALPLNRFQILKGRLHFAIKTANNAYANRASAYEKFQLYYPQLQQNVMHSTYALVAGSTQLDQLAAQIWTIGDEQLFLLVQHVSVRLKQTLPTLQKSIANVLGGVMDPELKWTATSRSLEMFYNSFSSLKACLKTRDERRGDGQQMLVDALALDRVHVWIALRPSSDDDLDGSLTGEQAVYQAHRVENELLAQHQLEAIRAQQEHQAFEGSPS